MTPIALQNFSDRGYDMLMPMMFMANMAIAGSTFAIWRLSKDRQEKSVSLSAAISALLGITEPALFGVLTRYKKKPLLPPPLPARWPRRLSPSSACGSTAIFCRASSACQPTLAPTLSLRSPAWRLRWCSPLRSPRCCWRKRRNSSLTSVRQAAHQPLSCHLHALHQHHQNHHRPDHHLVVKALITITDSKIAQPAAANNSCHR